MQGIINKKNALKDLSDEQFEILLPTLATELEAHGILYELQPFITVRILSRPGDSGGTFFFRRRISHISICSKI